MIITNIQCRSFGEGEGPLFWPVGLGAASWRQADRWDRVLRGRKSHEKSHGSEKMWGRNGKMQVVYRG